MCDSAKMEVYLNPVKYCTTPTGHPKGHPCCKIADYDDTALGMGTLTVHPWRAGPDCGKLLYYSDWPLPQNQLQDPIIFMSQKPHQTQQPLPRGYIAKTTTKKTLCTYNI